MASGFHIKQVRSVSVSIALSTLSIHNPMDASDGDIYNFGRISLSRWLVESECGHCSM